MKPFTLGPFLGMNNIREAYALTTEDGAFVQDALNIQFSNAGRIHRAAGATTVTTLTAGAHSMWSDGTRTLYVDTAALYRIDSFTSFSSTKIVDLTSNNPMSHEGFNGEVWYSNGTDSGRLSTLDAASPWAMTTPALPVLTAISGTLPAGRYGVAFAYTNADSEESGATATVSIELTSAGGIRVTLPGSSTGATHVKVYLSGRNGDVLTRYSTETVATASIDITAPQTTFGASPTTQYLQPLPAGQLVLFNGRMLSFKDNVLYYSEPWLFGLYDPRKNYIQFAEDISIVAPNQNGVYVAADITRWFAGPDISTPETVIDVLPYGAVPRTKFTHPDKPLVGWTSHKGVVLGDSQGQAKNVQEDNLDLDYSANTSGATVVRSTDGSSHLWSSES